MNSRKSAIIIKIIAIFALVLFIVLFGSDIKESFQNHRTIKTINKAMEMSLNLGSGSIETNILEGNHFLDEELNKVEAEFNVNNPNKDKKTRNIDFNVIFTYADRQEEVNNVTNYEGIYLNLYYPYTKYNEINSKEVKYLTVNNVDKGKEYFVYYNGSHISSRVEWKYYKVESDYEYFLINDDGVIIEYERDTHYKQKEKKNSKWVDGESHFNVKLKDYTLL